MRSITSKEESKAYLKTLRVAIIISLGVLAVYLWII